MNDVAYTGLCVKGPLDGKMLTHQTPYFEVAEAPAMRRFVPGLTLEDQVEATTLHQKTHTYTHASLTLLGRKIDIWTWSSDTITDALEHVLEAYTRLFKGQPDVD